MKHLYILFFFLCIFIDGQMHRFIYEVDYRKDSTDQAKTKAYFLLDVTNQETFYYSRDYFVMDSITRSGAALDLSAFSGAPNLSPVTRHQLNTPTFDYYEVVEYNTLHLQSNEKQNWQLTSDVKQVGDLQLQKATCSWGKRNWTAWFANEIPFNAGPEKFYGLPGIIFELQDDRDQFSFKLIKSEVVKEIRITEPLPFLMKESIAVTNEKYRKAKLMWYDDPLSFLKNSNIVLNDDNWAMLTDGTKVTKKNTREVILKQREKLKKNNNPLDLNMIIHYPKN